MIITKLKEYSPAEFNLHTVRITFMSGVYVGHIAYRCGGSCRGGEILDVDYLETIGEDYVREFVENDCQFTFDEEDDWCSAVLFNGDDTLFIDGEPRDFTNLVVGIEIIDCVPE